jgi:hypothetical protein
LAQTAQKLIDSSGLSPGIAQLKDDEGVVYKFLTEPLTRDFLLEVASLAKNQDSIAIASETPYSSAANLTLQHRQTRKRVSLTRGITTNPRMTLARPLINGSLKTSVWRIAALGRPPSQGVGDLETKLFGKYTVVQRP